MKWLDEYAKSTDSGIHAKLKDGDVKGLIKMKTHIQHTYDQEVELQLKQDEVFHALKHLERDGTREEAINMPFCPLQGKSHTFVLRALRSISEAP